MEWFRKIFRRRRGQAVTAQMVRDCSSSPKVAELGGVEQRAVMVSDLVSDMIYAISRRDVQEVRRLLNSGVNANVVIDDVDGVSGTGNLLHQCARQYSDVTEIARMLIENGADVNLLSKHSGSTPLGNAAYCGNTKLAELLLNEGAEVDRRGTSYANQLDCTPLATAAHGGKHDTVALLLERGADPNLLDKRYRTRLHKCREAKPEIATLLKKYGDVGLESDEVPEKYRDLASKVTEWYTAKGREVADDLNWEEVVRDLDGWFGPGVPRHLIAEAEQLWGGPKASPKAKFTMRIGSVSDAEFGVMVAGSPEGAPPGVGDTVELVRASGTTQVRLKDSTSMGSRWAFVLEGVKPGNVEMGDILQS